MCLRAFRLAKAKGAIMKKYLLYASILFLISACVSVPANFISANTFPEKEFVKYAKTSIKNENPKLLFVLQNEGSETPPMEMYFFSNGIAVLSSKSHYSSIGLKFFRYTDNRTKKELVLESIDTRQDLEKFFTAAEYHISNGSVIKADRKTNTVTYRYNKGFYFSGYFFHE